MQPTTRLRPDASVDYGAFGGGVSPGGGFTSTRGAASPATAAAPEVNPFRSAQYAALGRSHDGLIDGSYQQYPTSVELGTAQDWGGSSSARFKGASDVGAAALRPASSVAEVERARAAALARAEAAEVARRQGNKPKPPAPWFGYLMLLGCLAGFSYELYLTRGIAPLDVNPMIGPDVAAMVQAGGKVASLIEPPNHQWWRLITPMWLHAGVIHLVVNMSVLLRFGFQLETTCGSTSRVVAWCCTCSPPSSLPTLTVTRLYGCTVRSGKLMPSRSL